MLDLLWLVPVLPLAGFLALTFAGRRLAKPAVTAIGVGSVGLSSLVAGAVAAAFLGHMPPGGVHRQILWRWFDVAGLRPEISLHLDALSLVMILVVTGVGFLIHLYSAQFMEEDADFARFFASMNLFVAMMLVLVLAGDLLLLYLGWEGVGLCSFLLIGFWYGEPANVLAARKAFVVTRVGDVAMAIGLFILVDRLGTLDLQAVVARAEAQWAPGSAAVVAVAALLLGGAVGKSAQLPLQTWLPDAMAGPTPVSALIHAATMVTAGVYLVARTGGLFELAPSIRTAVAVIGTATLLLAAGAALVQRDIKRILAYSTISQLGYMFLGLGVGSASAAIFHLVTHAFFKALLFLGAGAVIYACHHEHDIFRLGGLRRSLPTVTWTFVAGAAALAGFPLVTAGFYSKDLVLWRAFAGGHFLLWGAGLLGAFVTALYSFRLVFVVFWGETGTEAGARPGWRMTVPLTILAALSLVGGWLGLPAVLEPVLGAAEEMAEPHGTELLLQVLAGVVSLGGIALAWALYGRPGRHGDPVADALGPVGRWWRAGWGFDALYDRLFVRPYDAVARALEKDPVDRLPAAAAGLARGFHRALALTQNGRLRWYALSLAAGATFALYLVLTL